MSKVNHKKYDVVIIGAGIGGLVCGCYLAQKKLKVLLVDKNRLPGGYCASFKRKEYIFDACVHSLGSLGEEGIVTRVLKELDISNRINFIKYDPSDLVITPDFETRIWSDLNKTVKELGNIFPLENENLRRFFNFISQAKGFSTFGLRNITFENLLEQYFKDNKLKAVFSIFVLGNVGLPASYISAFTAVKFYQQFMLDGGYYPDGGEGIQEFPLLLANRFKEFGGEFLKSSIVNKIVVENNRVKAVQLKNGTHISAKYVVSNIDARQTFMDLIGENNVDGQLLHKLEQLEPSLSMFVCYFGFKENAPGLPKVGINTWILLDYDLGSMYELVKDGNTTDISWYMARLLADGKSLLMFTNAPFISMEYWKENKERFIDLCIQKLGKIIPNIEEYIIYREGASPATMYKWTRNYNGAAYGWEGRPNQLAVPGISQTTSIENLYLTGHWTSLAQGTPGVTLLGRDTAQVILRREKKHV